jgi:hypothetical protein
MTFLDTLNAAANIPEASYITFLQQYKFKDTTIHLFYEGVEDSVFYNTYIQNLIDSNHSTQVYICDGKNNVLQNYNDINWNKYNKNRVLFFIDKDLEDIQSKNIITDENIFRTKYYSIESYLVCSEVLERFLKETCNLQDQPLINNLKAKFNDELVRFHKKLLTLSCWIVFCRGNNLILNLNDIKITDFIKLDADLTVIKQIPNTYISMYDYVCNRIRLCHLVPYVEILRLCKTLPNTYGYKSFVRGKYELVFLYLFCKKVVDNVLPPINKGIAGLNKANPGNIMRKCKIFSITEDNIFDVLAPKVKIPDELKYFLVHNLRKAKVMN